MTLDFDTPIDRRGTDSVKWQLYGDDVLPLWVADMDFRSAQPIIDALVERVQHGIFGYGTPSEGLYETLLNRLATRHHWNVSKEALVFLPGLVTGLNIVVRTIGEPGDGVTMTTPIYPPFLGAVKNAGRTLDSARLREVRDGHTVRYEIDFDALEAAVTPRTRLFMLCNPHNPTGRVYTRAELEQIAAFCERHDLIICSDEIHCDLILGDTPHISIASLGPEVAARTITLLAPSKTFNVPGLGFSFAVVENADLRRRLQATAEGIVPHPNVLGFTAAEAAYRDGGPWLEEMTEYLRDNRDLLVNFVRDRLPDVSTTVPEGTYLAWLDFRDVPLPEGVDPFRFCLEHAKVALNDGVAFGPGGEGFTRLNFGCPRDTLALALEEIAQALESYCV
jgi:cystathionine beta-lyase